MFYREAGQYKTNYAADMALFPILQDRIGIGVILLVQAAVGIQDICPEPLGQHWQQRRTGQQDLAGDLVGIHQRDTMGGKYRRHSRFAAAAAAGDPKRDHSWITRNAAARIRRLYTAMDRPSFLGQRA